MISLVCGIIQDKTKQNKTKLIENRLAVARGGGWRWEKWVKGVKRHKLPDIR